MKPYHKRNNTPAYKLVIAKSFFGNEVQRVHPNFCTLIELDKIQTPVLLPTTYLGVELRVSIWVI